VVAVVRRDKEFSTLARVTQPAMMLQVDNPLRVAGAQRAFSPVGFLNHLAPVLARNFAVFLAHLTV